MRGLGAMILATLATALPHAPARAQEVQEVQEKKIPGVVHLRGGETLRASDIQIDGLLETRGVELQVEGKEYFLQLARIDSMRFLRIEETANRYIGPDSKIRVSLRNGETVTATNAQLDTRVEVTYPGKVADTPRTRRFFINGSKEATLSDPDDVLRIDFRDPDR